MLGLLAVPLSEIKSYVVLLSFYIKMIKGRRLQACSLRHSIKKGMLSVLGKLDLFKLGRGEVLLPSPPPLWLRASVYSKMKLFQPSKIAGDRNRKFHMNAG